MEDKSKATIPGEDVFPGWASPQSFKSEAFHSERNAKRKNKNKNSRTESSVRADRKTLKWQSPKQSSKKASHRNRKSITDDGGDCDDVEDLFKCGRHDCDNQGIETSLGTKRKTIKWQCPKKSSKKLTIYFKCRLKISTAQLKIPLL